MVGVIILCALTCLGMILSILVFPTIKIKKIENMSNEYCTNMDMGTYVLSVVTVAAGTTIGAGLAKIISVLQKHSLCCHEPELP